MTPDEMEDAQFMRLITLGLAVVWTTTSDHLGAADVMDISEAFARYIETGDKGMR